MWSSKPKTKFQRYYYSKKEEEKTFEKSLDVYKPVHYDGYDEDDRIQQQDNSKDLPIVTLVVGSGWVGHRAFVYSGTSWWNSAGPKTVAKLGTTCVCIRHRGAFCVIPPASVLAPYLMALLAMSRAVSNWTTAFIITSLAALFLALLAIGGRGSAKFDDMLHDVAEALQWIDDNRHLLSITEANTKTARVKKFSSSTPTSSAVTTPVTSESSYMSSDDSDSEGGASPPSTPPPTRHHPTNTRHSSSPQHFRNNTSSNTPKNEPLVFGGYSSGGHVAATLLQHPEIFEQHNLPPPEQLFTGILMISGMMAVRPETLQVERTKTSSNDESSSLTVQTPQGPTFLTNFVVNIVWGPDAPKIPSPIATAVSHPLPNLPHLLLGCRNEVFGLSILDVYFCQEAFRQVLQTRIPKQPIIYRQVESDHWNILNSQGLSEALADELPSLTTTRQRET